MAELNHTQKAMKGLMIIILAVEIYLVIANLSYVFFKFRYHLPPLLRNDVDARHYRNVAEFSRSGFLILVTVYTALKVCWTDIFGENTSREPCNIYFRIPTVWCYFCMNCRVVFAYGRLGLFKTCCNKPFVKERIGFVVTLVILFAATMWNQAMLDYKIVDDVCYSLINSGVIVTCAIAFVTFELASFILYYRPLRETGRLSIGALERCSTFLTTDVGNPYNALSEINEPIESSESVFASMSVSSITQHSCKSTPRMHKVSMNSKNMIERFHTIVRRNFYAGLATVFIAFLQGAIGISLHGTESAAEFGMSSATRTWYWRSGVGQVVDKGLTVALYISMMLSESNWQQAFVPFLLCKEDSWDF